MNIVVKPNSTERVECKVRSTPTSIRPAKTRRPRLEKGSRTKHSTRSVASIKYLALLFFAFLRSSFHWLRMISLEIRWIFQAYSSDLNRAYQTCCIILSHNATSAKDLEVEKLKSLRERGFGPWEGKLVSEYQAEAKKAAIPGFDVSDIIDTSKGK